MSTDGVTQPSPKKRKSHDKDREKLKSKSKKSSKSEKKSGIEEHGLVNGETRSDSNRKSSDRIVPISGDSERRLEYEYDGDKSKTKSKHSKKRTLKEGNLSTAQSTSLDSPRKKSKSKHRKSAKPDDSVPFFMQSASLYIPLSPIAQSDPIAGICAEHLSPLLLTYYSPLSGIVLSYSNPRLSEDPNTGSHSESQNEHVPVYAKAVGEYAVSFVWVTAEFLVFKPERNAVIEAHVNLHNESHLGLIFLNLFSVSIPRDYLPKEWSWVESAVAIEDKESVSPKKKKKRKDEELDAEGYWIREDGEKLEGYIKLRIRDFETVPWSDHDKGFVSIEGSLVDMLEDEQS